MISIKETISLHLLVVRREKTWVTARLKVAVAVGQQRGDLRKLLQSFNTPILGTFVVVFIHQNEGWLIGLLFIERTNNLYELIDGCSDVLGLAWDQLNVGTAFEYRWIKDPLAYSVLDHRDDHRHYLPDQVLFDLVDSQIVFGLADLVVVGRVRHGARRQIGGLSWQHHFHYYQKRYYLKGTFYVSLSLFFTLLITIEIN